MNLGETSPLQRLGFLVTFLVIHHNLIYFRICLQFSMLFLSVFLLGGILTNIWKSLGITRNGVRKRFRPCSSKFMMI